MVTDHKADRRRVSGRRDGDASDPAARIAMLVIKEMREQRKVHEKSLTALQDIHSSVLRVEALLSAQTTLAQLRRAIADAGAELESIRIVQQTVAKKTG